MLARLLFAALAATLAFGSGAAEPPEDPYIAQVNAQRAERVANLTKPDGWLTLVGLHFLRSGLNTVGTAGDNQIVLAAGPRHLGTVELFDSGRTVFTCDASARATVDGQAVDGSDILAARNGGKASIVASGTVSFFVIERGGRKALRVRDSASDRRSGFLGIDYFPTDPSWRVTARWEAFEVPRKVKITNIIGDVSEETVPGQAVFERNGRTYTLLPIVEKPGDPLFFIISDATSGKETYRMRFLDANPPRDGKVVLDFNLAENPPCAFTPFATCPLPPRENRLGLAVTAGERAYRGSHE